MKIPTLIRGVLYESMSDAARKLGVSYSAIWNAAERGALDSVGMSRRSVNVRGNCYPSISAAARALGVAYSTVRDALERGTQDNIGSRKNGNA